jgi:hypothetical protein
MKRIWYKATNRVTWAISISDTEGLTGYPSRQWPKLHAELYLPRHDNIWFRYLSGITYLDSVGVEP